MGHPRIHARRAIFVVLLVVSACWAFLELADAVGKGSTRSLDERILTALRRPEDLATPHGPAWLVQAGRDLTALGGPTILFFATAAAAGYLAMRRKPVTMMLVLVSGIGAMVVGTLLKIGYGRERPSLVPHLLEVSSPSFPSGHAMASAAVYLSLGLLLAKVQSRRIEKLYILVTAMLLTFLVGLTRIYLGVHYPSDVLAGWMAGSAWALGCGSVAEAYERRGKLDDVR
jgi:undecaprenyl-diphosphatase